MSETVELNQGEVKVKFETPVKEGKISFAELGLKKESLVFEGGLLRLVFDFEKVKDISIFKCQQFLFSTKKKWKKHIGSVISTEK